LLTEQLQKQQNGQTPNNNTKDTEQIQVVIFKAPQVAQDAWN